MLRMRRRPRPEYWGRQCAELISCMPAARRFTSVGFGSRVWRRENASKRCVSAAARFAAPCAAVMYRSTSVRRPCCMRICISSSEPEMPASRLLKSCAKPPVSWPTASIFCDWRKASSVAARSRKAVSMRSRSVALSSRKAASLRLRSAALRALAATSLMKVCSSGVHARTAP